MTVSADYRPAPAPASVPVPAGRVVALDVFRGVAIMAVVALHTSGMGLRYAPEGSALGTALAVLNRSLLFVVPAFVFMTALVLTRSALRHFDLRRYYASRARTALLPYLLWTLLYVLFRFATGQEDAAQVREPGRWAVWLLYGKGYYHLYFLLVVLQFYAVLPLLLPLWRRRWPLWGVLLAAAVAQLAVYGLNRVDVLEFAYPATMAVWYLPTLALGMYFGANEGAFEALWARGRVWIVGVTALTLAWFLPLSLSALQEEPVSTLAFSAANWAYTAAAVLVLFGASLALAATRGRWVRALTVLGTLSLQVYLLHPALLYVMERWGFPAHPLGFAATLLGYGLAALLVPLLIARALTGTAASRWLFGR
ncbi:peptidoglycan/LPS O-acetylase OafA/YrhL [Deinococcus metalli]|uniref:Acyltransferase n=1 Tax=Deinococcus metalli TaxID=1141878 RepID=A0A7W8NRK3_9DEIO|nr:acyltransferase [Deinococcus metalli]MBB5376983.1 peptidoglycan/LPS O-acetylase OafA/YrhL [Deinococcus metalli]GHF46815.1 acyltransferase [Deinococcus metalli]